jgi:hypothetical protein
MDLKELSNSLRSWFSERMASPFFAALVISWVCFNWAPLYLLIFDSKNAHSNLSYIYLCCWRGFFSLDVYACRQHIFPLLTATFWVLVFPHFSRWFYEYSRFTDNKFKLVTLKWDNRTPISIEERNSLILEISRVESVAKAEQDRLIAENQRLREANALLQNRPQESKIPERNSRLDTIERDEVSDRNQVSSDDKIALRMKLNNLQNEVGRAGAIVRQPNGGYFTPNKLKALENKFAPRDKFILGLLPVVRVDQKQVSCSEIPDIVDDIFNDKYGDIFVSVVPENMNDEGKRLRAKILRLLALTNSAIQALST